MICDRFLTVLVLRTLDANLHLVNTLANLQAYGAVFISLRDNLDLSTCRDGSYSTSWPPCMAELEGEHNKLVAERATEEAEAAKKLREQVGSVAAALANSLINGTLPHEDTLGI